MSDKKPIPVAVIGAGNMGANHVRVYDELPEANLVEVVEPKPEGLESLEELTDVRVVETIDDINHAVAASIAVPNDQHEPTALSLLEHGLDLLIEKPLAPTVEGAERIVSTADARDAVLQVGHIEQFNPAIEVLREILGDEQIVAMESHRLGPFNEHLTDTDVIFDLMIHDLDVIDSLVDGRVQSVSAVGATPRSPETDHASALLKYDSGETGSLTASHVTHGKIRQLAVTTIDSYITVNYQDQRLTIQQRGRGSTTTMAEQSGYRTETTQEIPFIQTREPLKNELEHFLTCIRNQSTPRVDGNDGLQALKLSQRVLEQIGKR
jgi:predicted dehydrogenase